MSDSAIIPNDSDNPAEVSIATTLIPWRKDDYRARFLGYLACGFNVEESLYMLGLNLAWLEEQRQDKLFSSFELKVPEIRKELSKEYIELDFFRNFRLVLEKDYRILNLSLKTDSAGTPYPMSKQDHDYLLKLRSAYSPQQLQIMEQVMKGVGTEGWNFAKLVADNQNKILEFSRTDKITVMDKPSEIPSQSSQDNLE
jgi:hypothetical protein